MKEELANQSAIPRQVALERVDVLVPISPHVPGDERRRKFLPGEDVRMHPNHEHFFVVRPIEDPDPSPFRQCLVRPPEIIVIQLFVRWPLERIDLGALRIQAAHHMFDRAVFAGRVHGLKNDQHGPPILGVEPFLQLREPLDAALETAGDPALVLERRGVAGAVPAQVHLFAGPHAKAIRVHKAPSRGSIADCRHRL